MRMKKQRLDRALVERGMVESCSLAQRLIMAGQVRVEGQVVAQPSVYILEGARLEIDLGDRFVSRGGDKLAAALESFPVQVAGKICADVGASTGGFTDCLLQHGAARVYAIDVGQGILHWRLRQDPRVVVMENTNARYVEKLPEEISLATIDASFISLKLLLPVVKGWLIPPAAEPANQQYGCSAIIGLIKPQFEARRRQVARGEGVIRDPAIHRQILLDILEYAWQEGLEPCGLIRSSLLGPKGNTEFLAWWIYPVVDPHPPTLSPASLIEAV